MTSGRRGKVVIKPDKRWVRMMERRANQVASKKAHAAPKSEAKNPNR